MAACGAARGACLAALLVAAGVRGGGRPVANKAARNFLDPSAAAPASDVRWGYATVIDSAGLVPLALQLAFVLRQHGARRPLAVLHTVTANVSSHERAWLLDLGCVLVRLHSREANADPFVALARPNTTGWEAVAYIQRGALVRGNMDSELPIAQLASSSHTFVMAACGSGGPAADQPGASSAAPACAARAPLELRTLLLRPSAVLHSQLIAVDPWQGTGPLKGGRVPSGGKRRLRQASVLPTPMQRLRAWAAAHPSLLGPLGATSTWPCTTGARMSAGQRRGWASRT